MSEQAPLSRLFIIGPMGSGKSTVGRHLADLLGYGFIDSDAEIETRAGADIPWIFDVEGEEGFRRRETAVLEDLARVALLRVRVVPAKLLATAHEEHLVRDLHLANVVRALDAVVYHRVAPAA